MKKIKLYLDDLRTPNNSEWQIVRNYDEFVDHILKNGLENYEVISLDHDLGDSAMQEYFNNVYPNNKLDYNNIKEKTGFDCAKWLVNYAIEKNVKLPQIYSHSANPIGALNIITYINNYLKSQNLKETTDRIRINHS